MPTIDTQLDRIQKKLWDDREETTFTVLSIATEAARIFEKAGCPADFCLQSWSMGVMVFGGTNRLKWTAGDGFYPDRSYCTDSFLEAFDDAQ